MLIEAKSFKHWMDHFYGYGSWDAKFWFIGHEEGGGDLPEEVAEKINFFIHKHPMANGPTLCDIRDLYQAVAFWIEGPRSEVFANLFEYRFGTEAKLHGLWKNLIAFVHGYRNKTIANPLLYQKKNFAAPSTKANEVLIPLYPLPSPHNHAWYYAWLDMPQFGFLKSRAQYEAHFYQSRIQTILAQVEKHNPEVVLMYGMNNINLLKESVTKFFREAKFRSVKAIKQQIPQHHRADFNNTKLIITTQVPALRHNRVETGFDWEKFGAMVRE